MKKKIMRQVAALSLAGAVGTTATAAVAPLLQTEPSKAQAAYTAQSFLTQIGPTAQQVATQYGLYPSVMIAQAMLESSYGNSKLAQAPNYNIFGIKGSYYGQSVAYQTQEWRDDHYETITQNFKRYPNLTASIQDNAIKLREGVSWDANYYSGTWIENTNSYEDATKWLTGRYATAPDYNTKLNSLIQRYNLTQYDPQVSAESGVVTIKTSGTPTYDKYAGQRNSNGDWLGYGTQWKYGRVVKLFNSEVWYEVGKDQWVSGQFVSVNGQIQNNSGVVRVNNGAGAAIHMGAAGTANGRVLAQGTDWRYFQTVSINGETWYNLGANQWVPGSSMTQM
ncbi:glucosaminidase domain-containing protein [Agrilactobacillus fermenti]|uniref:glucosaminidase domain-containing protein n=1 Tax=Agrilactobacillus fermenti TaxID=2586909 RepID=UPI001E526C83|nr:glucosaminidase domain-containing protein [Agrilactobacillus fermenti]MCD2256622.1 glucosaminidase domain-containing protein [Agrilactobacillus fermenti]